MRELIFESGHDGSFPYWLHVPDGLDDDALPLVLFLHGAGERGNDLSQVVVHGPPRQVISGQELPFVLVAPQCSAGSWWAWHLDALDELLDHVVSTVSVDPDRVYLTGISMGAIGAWELATKFPDRFAALAPISGRGTPWMAPRLAHVPVWAFHGDADDRVPHRHSQEMVEAVNNAGGNAHLTTYSGVGHDAWTETYDNPKFYDWLLAQHRNSEEPNH